ncbi:hypothetical protein AAH978_11345 [Streptomyces sp. ZYX-F-203]
MRVYLPLTLPGLAAASGTGELGAAPLRAHAVTPALRAWCGSDDVEELEYAALGRAARESLRLLVEDPAAPRRRVVVALDVPDRAVRPAADPVGPADVRILVDVPLSWAASVHVDADDAEPVVTGAVEALRAADDAEAHPVAAADDRELLWYATQEIPDLVGTRG